MLINFGSRKFFPSGRDVSVSAAGAELPDVELLALFGWYIRVLAEDDVGAAAAAGAAS